MPAVDSCEPYYTCIANFTSKDDDKMIFIMEGWCNTGLEDSLPDDEDVPPAPGLSNLIEPMRS